jgi:hypothetical protein
VLFRSFLSCMVKYGVITNNDCRRNSYVSPIDHVFSLSGFFMVYKRKNMINQRRIDSWRGAGCGTDVGMRGVPAQPLMKTPNFKIRL